MFVDVRRIARPHAVVGGVHPSGLVVQSLQPTVGRPTGHWWERVWCRAPRFCAFARPLDVPPRVDLHVPVRQADADTVVVSEKDGQEQERSRRKKERLKETKTWCISIHWHTREHTSHITHTVDGALHLWSRNRTRP